MLVFLFQKTNHFYKDTMINKYSPPLARLAVSDQSNAHVYGVYESPSHAGFDNALNAMLSIR